MNDGASTGGGGSAQKEVRAYNRGRVAAVADNVDQPLVDYISDMLDDSRKPRLCAGVKSGAREPEDCRSNRSPADRAASHPPSSGHPAPSAAIAHMLRVGATTRV
jgi:hypothetical protein